MLYLDSSALLKLVIVERESTALLRFLNRDPAERVSCALVRTEVFRAVRPHGAAALELPGLTALILSSSSPQQGAFGGMGPRGPKAAIFARFGTATVKRTAEKLNR